jgi:hypothetical protein
MLKWVLEEIHVEAVLTIAVVGHFVEFEDLER